MVDAVRGRAKMTKICTDGPFSVLRAIVVDLLLEPGCLYVAQVLVPGYTSAGWDQLSGTRIGMGRREWSIMEVLDLHFLSSADAY